MKKKILQLLLVIILFVITGCVSDDFVVKLEYELDLSLLPEEIYVDEFEIQDIRIKEIQESGEFKYIVADDSMFSKKEYKLFSVVGTHAITIKYRFFEDTFTITLLEKEGQDLIGYFSSSNPYYSQANGLSGEELKLSLRTIISVVTKEETYGDLRTDLAKTDADPNNPNNIILLYTGKSVSNKWDGGSTWNREHVWPRSLGWFSDTGAGADLHHIRPTSPSENSSRGNDKFGESSGYYEPRDEVKGDIARIIFYLMVRYQEADTRTFETVAESKELLLRWHESDPVDAFEMNRNEVTYLIQGNRNPFIDHPECANLIWGTVKVIHQNQLYNIDIIMFIPKKETDIFKSL